MPYADSYEDKAREFLRLKGYRIICNNFRSRFGEIDIIARDKPAVCFIEVKARSLDYLVSGIEAIDAGKKNKIRKTALFYISKTKLENKDLRFDVLEIIQGRGWYQYNLIKNAFGMDNF